MSREATSRFRIRPARDTDVPALCDLLDQLFAQESDFQPDRSKQRRGLTALVNAGADRAAVLVAEERGKVVGMATCQTLISTAEGGAVGLVEDVVVDRDRRGHGLGHALLDALEDWARKQGLKRLQLLADVDNLAALEFYRHAGWQKTRLIARRKYPA